MPAHRGRITKLGGGWSKHTTTGQRKNTTHMATGPAPTAHILNTETGEEAAAVFKDGGILQDLDGVVSYLGEDVAAIAPVVEELAPLAALL